MLFTVAVADATVEFPATLVVVVEAVVVDVEDAGVSGFSGSGVSSFLVGVVLARVTARFRLNELCLRRRCGLLLLAPGVFFHK